MWKCVFGLVLALFFDFKPKIGTFLRSQWLGLHGKKMQQKNEQVKALVQDVLATGDLLLISEKSHGKTEALKTLASEFRKQPNTRVIIFEDFPKWIHEFECIPFMRIRERDVKETQHLIDLENDFFLRHERSYSVLRGKELKEALESKKDIIFLMQFESIEKSAFFIYSVVKYFYRRAYLRLYKGYKKHEKVMFFVEESQNCFDSSVISKKIFNRLRKIFSVSRNLFLHFIMATQRMQDLNTKIRARTRLMLGRVSIDDYELKINRILRHSQYRKEILDFEKGNWLYVATDTKIKLPMLPKQQIKPYEINKPLKPRKEPQAKKKWVFSTYPLFGLLPIPIIQKVTVKEETKEITTTQDTEDELEREFEEEESDWDEFLTTEEEWE